MATDGIDNGIFYEVHRPGEMLSNEWQHLATLFLDAESKKVYEDAKRRAGGKTAGPIVMASGNRAVSAKVAGPSLDEMYWMALKEGANPCYIDRRDGFVYMGEYVFVPTEETLPEGYEPPRPRR